MLQFAQGMHHACLHTGLQFSALKWFVPSLVARESLIPQLAGIVYAHRSIFCIAAQVAMLIQLMIKFVSTCLR